MKQATQDCCVALAGAKKHGRTNLLRMIQVQLSRLNMASKAS